MEKPKSGNSHHKSKDEITTINFIISTLSSENINHQTKLLLEKLLIDLQHKISAMKIDIYEKEIEIKYLTEEVRLLGVMACDDFSREQFSELNILKKLLKVFRK